MSRREVVLVTGSGGLLGRRICRALGADGKQVVGMDLQEPAEDEHHHRWIACDLTDQAAVDEALGELADACGTDGLAAVVHLAAHYDFSGAESPLYQELTVEGTRRLLRGVRPLDPGRFVFASSILAMRPAEFGMLLDEGSPELAEWAYPGSKLEAEAVLREEREGLPVTVLRIAGCYDEDCHSIPIAQQIRRIHRQQFKSHFFPGDTRCGQSFVHVDDVADLVRRVVARGSEGPDHDLFVVGEPAWPSYADLQDRIGEALHGTRWATLRVPGAVAKAGAWIEHKLSRYEAFIKPWMIDLADAHYPVDITRARERLGWEPRHRLVRVLPEMLRRLERDPERWYAENDLQGLPEDDEAERGEESPAAAASGA